MKKRVVHHKESDILGVVMNALSMPSTLKQHALLKFIPRVLALKSYFCGASK